MASEDNIWDPSLATQEFERDRQKEEPVAWDPEQANKVLAEDRSSHLRDSVETAVDVNPDERARAEKLAGPTGIDADIVEQDLPGFEREEKLRKINFNMGRENPAAAKFLSDPNNAKLAHDDIENLTGFERLWVAAREGFQTGVATDDYGELLYKEATYGLSDEEHKQLKRLQYDAGQQAPTGFASFVYGSGELLGMVKEGLVDAADEGAAGALVGIAAGATTGPLAPVTSTVGGIAGFIAGITAGLFEHTYRVEYGHNWAEVKNIEGVDENAARSLSTVVGVVNASLELTGLSFVAKGLGLNYLTKKFIRDEAKQLLTQPTFRTALTNFAKAYGTAISGETVTEMIQEVAPHLSQAVLKAQTTGDFDLDMPGLMEKMAQVGAKTAKGMALLAIPGPSIGLAKDVTAMRKAQRDQDTITAMGTSAEASKVRERLPEKYREFVTAVKDLGDVENIHIPAQQMVEYFQSVDIDVEKLAEEVPAIKEQMKEALATNGDIVIPLQDYATYLAPTEHHSGLAQDIRFHAGDMTYREAKEFESNLTETNKLRDEKIAELQAEQEAQGESTQRVVEDVREQLINAGQAPENAELLALMHGAFFNAQAERTGVDAFELYSGQQLSIVGPEGQLAEAEGVTFDQPAPAPEAGVSFEVAPAPSNEELTQAFNALTPEAKQEATQTISDAMVPKVMEALDIADYKVDLTTGGYLENVNPAVNIQMEGKTLDELTEIGKVLGYITSQQSVVSYNENITEGEGLTSFVQVVPTTSMRYTAQQELYEFLRERVPEIEGYTWRNEAMVIGNFTDKPDAEFYEAIAAAVEEHEGAFDILEKQFQSELSDATLEGTRYDDTEQAEGAARGQAIPGDLRRGDVGALDSLRQEAASALGQFIQGQPGIQDGRPPQEGRAARPTIGEGRETTEFFTNVTRGAEGLAQEGAKYSPVIDVSDRGDLTNFTQVYLPFRGSFDQHIAYSIPGYREVQQLVGNAIRLTFDTGTMLDIGASEGALAKAVGSTSGLQVTALDPNVAMQETFNEKGQVAWVEFDLAAFGTKEQEGQVAWEEDGVEIPYFAPVGQYDVVHEAMVFQFMSPDREAQIARARELVKDDGILIIEEKFHLEDESAQVANEAKKNEYKQKHFSKEAISSKAEDILVGMNQNMRVDTEVETILSQHFGNVTQFWDSGNFKGYVASNNAEALGKFVENLGDTSSEFANVDTPRNVTQELFQEDKPPVKRGSIKFTGDDKTVISLFEDQNLSTFIHESGHFFLNVIQQLAEAEGTPAQVAEDWQTIRDWMGLVEGQDIGVEQHEQWARAFEAYLFEGTSPSIEMQSAFQRFSAWLTRLYQSIQNLDVSLTDEVRQVMDRMVATEAQINASEQSESQAPMFPSVTESGMTGAEYKAYLKLSEQASEEAKSDLLARTMLEVTRETKRWWKQEKELTTEEVTAEYHKLPVYNAKHFLMTGESLDGTLPEGVEPVKLAKDALVAMYGAKGIWKKLPIGKHKVIATEGGVHPDIVADMFGFGSGDEMVQAIVKAENLNKAIATEVDRRMLEKHGDILTDGTIEEEARKVLHSERRAEMIAAEYRALQRLGGLGPVEKGAARVVAQQGAGTPEQHRQAVEAAQAALDTAVISGNQAAIQEATLALRSVQAQATAAVVQRRAQKAALRQTREAQHLNRKAIRQLAQQIIGGKPIRDTQPGQYAAAEMREAKAATEALARRDYVAAAEHTKQRMLNFYLYSEARNARDESDKILRYMNKFSRSGVRKKLPPEYMAQIDATLEDFELRRSISIAQAERAQSYAAWVEGQIAEENAVYINEKLMAGARQHWRTMTLDEFRALKDTIRNMETLGKLKHTMQVGKERREFQEVVDKFNEIAQENLGQKITRSKRLVLNSWDRVEGTGEWWLAYLTKVSRMVQWMDGDKPVGFAHEVITQRVNDAQFQENEMMTTIGRKIFELFEGMSPEQRARVSQTVYVPEIGESVKGETILAVALNLGNASNRAKLIEGYGWTDSQVEALLSHMRKEDWDLVQNVWTDIDQLWAPMRDLIERTTGVVPEKIEAMEVDTPFGTYKGGYYPIIYNPRLDKKAEKHEKATDLANWGNEFERFNVTARSSNERTGYRGKILLELEVIPRHLRDTIHFITHFEAVHDLSKFLDNESVSETIKAGLGPAHYASMRRWLRDIKNSGFDDTPPGPINAFLRHLRVGTTIAVMGFKVSTGLMQVAGLSNSAAEIGPAYMRKGIRSVLGSRKRMVEARDFAFNNSQILKTRMLHMDRELRASIKAHQGKHGVRHRVAEIAFMHIGLMQTYTVDLPTWHGAYQKIMEETANHDKAVKYADFVVENVQGAAQVKDMAEVMRTNHEGLRALTMFYTFFSSLFAQYRNLLRLIKGAETPVQAAKVATAGLLFTTVLPVIYEDLMREGFEGEDDEDLGERAQRVALDIALYPVTSVPFVRDIVGGVFHGYGYDISPVAGLIESGVQLAGRTNDIAEGDITEANLRNAVQLAGVLTHLPTGQLWLTGDYLFDLAEGEADLSIHEAIISGHRE